MPIVLDKVDVFLQVGDDLKEKRAKDKDWQETHEVIETWVLLRLCAVVSFNLFVMYKRN